MYELGKAGTGRREVEKVQKGTISRQCISIPAHDFVPLHFPLLLLGGVLGRCSTILASVVYMRKPVVRGQGACRERDSSDVRGASGCKAECGGSVKCFIDNKFQNQ